MYIRRLFRGSFRTIIPFVFKQAGSNGGPISFQLDNKWLTKLKFVAMVEENWKNIVIQENASYRLARKLKEMKNVIKE